MYTGPHAKYHLFLSEFNEILILSYISEKYSNIKFHKTPSNVSRVVPCGQTDGHEQANSHFPQFCERAKQKMFSLAQYAIISTSYTAKCTETVSNAPPILSVPKGALIKNRDTVTFYLIMIH